MQAVATEEEVVTSTVTLWDMSLFYRTDICKQTYSYDLRINIISSRYGRQPVQRRVVITKTRLQKRGKFIDDILRRSTSITDPANVLSISMTSSLILLELAVIVIRMQCSLWRVVWLNFVRVSLFNWNQCSSNPLKKKIRWKLWPFTGSWDYNWHTVRQSQLLAKWTKSLQRGGNKTGGGR